MESIVSEEKIKILKMQPTDLNILANLMTHLNWRNQYIGYLRSPNLGDGETEDDMVALILDCNKRIKQILDL